MNIHSNLPILSRREQWFIITAEAICAENCFSLWIHLPAHQSAASHRVLSSVITLINPKVNPKRPFNAAKLDPYRFTLDKGSQTYLLKGKNKYPSVPIATRSCDSGRKLSLNIFQIKSRFCLLAANNGNARRHTDIWWAFRGSTWPMTTTTTSRNGWKPRTLELSHRTGRESWINKIHEIS